MEIDLAHLKSWVGREERAAEVCSAALVARFNATFDRVSGLEDGDEAPPLIHFCLAPPAAPTAGLGPDGHPERGGFLPPVPLPRRMWAGGAFEFLAPVRIGEVVERRSVIEGVEVKEGRTGRLCFVTVGHEIRSGGRLAVRERQDIVYREAAGAAKAEPAAAPEGSHCRRVVPSAAFLFRYSALTFNGHRIHYDRDWASEEGYPGLIVHGPLQATLLVQAAAEVRGEVPERFSFRSVSAIFDDADFTVNAEGEGEGFRLWTARVGGPVAMEARAEWGLRV